MYPPQTEMPVYQMQMMELAVPMSGILVNLLENDMENVLPNFEFFKSKYTEISKVVPEWENLYPMGPVNELGEALSSGEQGKVMAAFEKIGCPLPSGSCSRSLRQAAIDLINLDKKYNLEKTALKQQQRGVTWNIWNIFGKKGKIF